MHALYFYTHKGKERETPGQHLLVEIETGVSEGVFVWWIVSKKMTDILQNGGVMDIPHRYYGL